MLLDFTLNGRATRVEVRPDDLLLDVLRARLGLTGTKRGCGEGECGACTVLLDGRPVDSCLLLAAKVQGRAVTTIEGLAEGERLHPLQEAFLEAGAVQCGFCTPGMVLSAKALLDRSPDPGEEEIKAALSGNLCRCTGYVQIIEAVRLAAARLSGGPDKEAKR
jgi:carbon-monoxide dehydrogenase small subunit